MPVVTAETEIAAPIGVVFDLARNVDVHVASMAAHRERAVGGVTRGALGLGDEVPGARATSASLLK